MVRGPVIVVHGGAGNLESEDDRRLYLAGVAQALEQGLAALPRGASAAVLAAVVHMESHTIMNAGRGAALAADGSVALDAGFMDGTTRRYGAVTGVHNCVNPVLLAERLAAEGDFGRFVGPPGADALATACGLPVCMPEALISERARRIWQRRRDEAQRSPAGRPAYLDTVGAVALDAEGRVAAAVSTGGMSLKRQGRIGDSPVVGAGFWADDRAGACVTTGVGEALLREGTARRAVQRLAAGGATPERAARESLDELLDSPDDVRGASGLILLSPRGDVALDHNSHEMSAGWARPDGERRVTHLWRER
jgi:beta-aspartyl-peptidase (threonine type)